MKPHRFSYISIDKQKSFINKCFKNWTISVHLNCLFQGFQVLNLLFVTPSCESSHLAARNSEFNWFPKKFLKMLKSLKKTIQMHWNCLILVTFRNKTFLFVKIYRWHFVRFHEILNHEDTENFSFLSWQTKKFYS